MSKNARHVANAVGMLIDGAMRRYDIDPDHHSDGIFQVLMAVADELGGWADCLSPGQRLEIVQQIDSNMVASDEPPAPQD